MRQKSGYLLTPHFKELLVGEQYRLVRKLGSGGYGAVYLGNDFGPIHDCISLMTLATDLNTNEDVAIKLEHVSNDPSSLKTEVDIYRVLAGGAGIPQVFWYDTECDYRAMVFDLLGPTLEDLFNYCGR